MYDKNNIFAKILRHEIPCKAIYENDHVLAFEDINKVAPTHILVIPKGEYSSFDDFVQKASNEQIVAFFKAVQKIADDNGVVKDGYRLITNHGKDAFQSVAHFHVHIIAGKSLGGLLP